MQRYFIDERCIQDNEIKIDDYNHKHMQRVMRYKNGQSVICILPSKQTFEYEIMNIEKGLLKQKCEIIEEHELDVAVTLIYSLPKNDKFDLVLQKSTELGVTRIVPFLSKRCIVKTDQESFDKKSDRYKRILKEASEQSYRQMIPELTSLATLSDLSKYLSDINLVAYEEVSKQGEHGTLSKAINSNYKSITIIVGPEGGFEQSEIDIMTSMGIKECSLGKRILRSETAPLYMLSVIGYSRELMK